MDIPPSIQLDRARRRRKRRPVVSPPSPPPVTDSIVSVIHGGGDDEIIVTVSSAVVAVATPLGLWVSFDGGANWIEPLGANVTDANHVLFIFPFDVSTATTWHVEDGAAWEWQDGGPMNGPFDGEIAS
jgi:hypothetical protein